MSSARPRRPSRPAQKAASDSGAGPERSERRSAAPSRRGLYRFGLRSAIACAVVGCLTVVAGWHSAGLVKRGEIDRMLRMGASASRQAAEADSRGRLDRGRLKAVITATAR